MNLNTLGDRLKYALDDRGILQKFFADKIHVSENYVSLIVRGKNYPGEKTIDAICEELQLNKEWLVNGTGDMYLPSPQITELADLIDTLLEWEPSEFRTKFIKQLAALPLEHWHLIEEFVDNLQKNKADEE